MMNRRSPVRSVLAERRMFANGGMLPISTPMQNTMDQGQNKASGILASSTPLIEAVSQEILAPMTGGAMPVAGFHEGGYAHRHPHGLTIFGEPPKLQEGDAEGKRIYDAAYKSETPIGLQTSGPFAEVKYKPTVGERAEIGLGSPPEDLQKRANMTAAERLKSIFPYEAELTGGFFGPQKAREAGPGIGVDSTSLAEQAIEAPLAFIDETARNLSQANFAAGKFLMNLGKTIFKRGDQSFGTKYDQISTLGNLIRRQPTIEGVDSSEVTDTINRLADAYLGKNPDASGADLAKAVSEGVYNRFEAGYAMAAADADLVINEEARDKAIQDAEKAKKQEEALATDDYEGKSVSETEVSDLDSVTERPDQDSQAVLDGVITGSKAIQDIQSGVKKETALATKDALSGEKRATDETLLKIAAAAENKNVDRDMDFFKKRFIDSVGEYQGKTEDEKANDFIKLGMAIAAGKSDNAISNIANGVLATIDTFGVDDKQKRAFERKVNLSAAQYALSSVAKDEAQRDADRRKGFFFYDQSKKTKDAPYGELVRVSMADILANDGKIPDNLVEKELVLKDIASVKATTTALNEQILKNAELYRIDRVEADKIKENLSKYENAFISGEVGISLLNSVLANVAAGDITGFGSAGQELIGKAYKAAGLDPNKKYTKIEDAKADIGRVLQLLIPISLGKSQTANSISNRDVELLANAYIDSAFLNDNGVLGFITTGKDALGRKLMGAMKVFRDKQLEALAGFDDVINRLNTSNQRILSAQALGIPVDPGPFGRDDFAQILSRVSPLAERTRGLAQDSDQAAVQPRLWSYDFDPETNKFRYKGAEGTTFAGQFFEPTKENLGKLSIVPKD